MNCLCFPSKLNESLALVPIEALCCGVPVVARRNSVMETYIQNKKNGYLIDVVSAHALAEATFKLVEKNIPPELCRSSVMNYSQEKVFSKLKSEVKKVSNFSSNLLKIVSWDVVVKIFLLLQTLYLINCLEKLTMQNIQF